jgi:transposase
MTRFVGLDVSQKMTVICVVDNAGRRLWRSQCPTVPEQITVLVRRHAGDDAGSKFAVRKSPCETPRRSA